MILTSTSHPGTTLPSHFFHVTKHYHPVDLVTITIGEIHKSRSSPFCNNLQNPIISYFLGSNIFLALLSNTLTMYVPPLGHNIKFQTHVKQKVKLLLLLLLLTANGFSPGGSGTTITQQTDNTKNTLLQ
jgi:hypothetical protein